MSLIGRRKPIRQTILSLLGGFVLIIILLSSGFISFVIYRIEGDIWQERRQEAVGNAANTVQSFLDQIEKMLLFSVNDLNNDPKEDLKELKLLIDGDPAFYEIIQVDSAGRIKNSIAKGEKVLANSFAIRQSSWFQKVKEESYFLGPVEYSSDGQSYVIMAVSSPDAQIVAARVGMSVLSEIVEDIELGSSGQIFVIDQSGYILAHPDKRLTAGYTNIANNNFLTKALNFSGDLWNERYLNLEGFDVFGTAVRIGKTDWSVFAEVEVAEVYYNSHLLWLVQSITIICLGSLAMFVVARLLDLWIFNPIFKLRNGAESIQFGDLSARVPIFRIDEIGDVAHSFNKMATSLQKHEEDLLAQSDLLQHEVNDRVAAQQALEKLNLELEGRVEERTAELQKVNSLLLDSEKQFHGLVESIPAVTYQAMLHAEGILVTYVSPQIGDLTGFSPVEWRECEGWVRQVLSEDTPILEKLYGQLRTGVDHYSCEYRLLSRSGKVLWVRDQGTLQARGGGVYGIQGVMSDITLERERKEILLQQALHDGLTGLPNRNLFYERLGHIMVRARRHSEISYAVLFLDLDGFKQVNDTYGHAAGDQVLIEAGERIKSSVRGFDTVARFGGDEFVVLLEDPKDRPSICSMEQRIQTEIERPFMIEDKKIYLGVSIGMTSHEGNFETPDEMIRAADGLMYEAKIKRKSLPHGEAAAAPPV